MANVQQIVIDGYEYEIDDRAATDDDLVELPDLDRRDWRSTADRWERSEDGRIYRWLLYEQYTTGIYLCVLSRRRNVEEVYFQAGA